MTRRLLFADQLGPHFLGPADTPGDDGEEQVLLIESKAAFRRRRYHRAKAHLVLSALRHRAAELGPRFIYTLRARRDRAQLPDGSRTKSLDETLVASLRARGVSATYVPLKEWLK